MNCQWMHPFIPCYLTSVFGFSDSVLSGGCCSAHLALARTPFFDIYG